METTNLADSFVEARRVNREPPGCLLMNAQRSREGNLAVIHGPVMQEAEPRHAVLRQRVSQLGPFERIGRRKSSRCQGGKEGCFKEHLVERRRVEGYTTLICPFAARRPL